MNITKLEQSHIKRGLTRVWIVLIIAFCPFFAWKTIESYNDITTWKQLNKNWKELANTMEAREAEAPDQHPGGLDKLHYRVQKREYWANAIDAGHEILDAEENFIKFLLIFLAIPTLLPAAYFLAIYILKGFSKELNIQNVVKEEVSIRPEVINKKVEYLKVFLSFIAIIIASSIAKIFLPEIVVALFLSFGGITVIRMAAIVYKGGKAFW
jgi:hypothetical protein